MTAIRADEVFTLSQAGELHRVPASTVLKWVTVGVRVNGQRVRLAGYKAGGCWRVPATALESFIAACNPVPISPLPPSPAALARRGRAAKAHALQVIGGGP